MLIGFLLFTLYCTKRFRPHMPLGKRVIGVESALGRLPHNPSRRHALLRRNQDLLLLNDGGVELVEKFLVITPTGGCKSLLHQYLKTSTVVIPVLQQQLEFGFHMHAPAVQRPQAFRSVVSARLS